MTAPFDLDPLLPSDDERRSRRDALVAEVTRASEPARRRRSVRSTCRRIVPVALASALAVAVGWGGTSAVVGTSVPTVDVVAAARAATAPNRNEILHVVMRLERPRSDARPATAPRRANGRPIPTFTGRIERWSATEPLRDRTVWFVTLPDRNAVDRAESAYADGVRRDRESWRRGVRVTRLDATERAGYERDRLRADRSWLQNVTFSVDPVAGIRSLLAEDRLRDGGTTTVAGRDVRRLVGEVPAEAEGGSPRGTIAYEYLVDADTFAPVRVTTTRTLPARPSAADTSLDAPRTVTYHWTFERFERLPMNAENERLLTVPDE